MFSQAFCIIHKKTPVPESLFNKIDDQKPQTCNFVKKETPTQMVSCEVFKLLKTPFLYIDICIFFYIYINYIITQQIREQNKN